MAHYVNGIRMATDNEEIHHLMQMAGRLTAMDKKKKLLNVSIPEERKLIEIVLENPLADAVYSAELCPTDQNLFSISRLAKADTNSSFCLTGNIVSDNLLTDAAFHMFAFTYNADGPRRPVGIGDTVFSHKFEGILENTCIIRKVLLDTWHLGVMMTLVLWENNRYEAITQMVTLNKEQEDFFNRERRI